MENIVYGLLVTYNPEMKELEDVISSLLEQTDHVIISNNSEYNLDIIKNENITVLNFRDNLGIAKAQSIGMDIAFKSADFVLQLDQDSVLPDKLVSHLLDGYNKLKASGYKVGIIGPNHFDKITQEKNDKKSVSMNVIPGTNYEIVRETMSSASLISRDVYEKCGGMKDELFIDFVDFEYNWRINVEGFLTIKANDIYLGHRLGDGKKKVCNILYVVTPSPVRHYYHTRNIILLLSSKYAPLKWKIKEVFKLILKLMLYPFIFRAELERVRYIYKGLSDGLKGKTGKI